MTRLNKDNFLRWDGEFAITENISLIFAAANDVNLLASTDSNQIVISGLSAPRPISVAGQTSFHKNIIGIVDDCFE